MKARHASSSLAPSFFFELLNFELLDHLQSQER